MLHRVTLFYFCRGILRNMFCFCYFLRRRKLPGVYKMLDAKENPFPSPHEPCMSVAVDLASLVHRRFRFESLLWIISCEEAIQVGNSARVSIMHEQCPQAIKKSPYGNVGGLKT